MSSSNLEAGPETRPGAALEHALGWCGHAVLALMLAATLGGFTARAMRRAGVHWSWAALATAFALGARSALGAGAVTACLASLRASVLCRRWHREDLEGGSEPAGRARARRTPLDAVHLLAGRVAASSPRLRRAAVPGAPAHEARGARGRLQIGRDERGRPVTIAFGAGCEPGGERAARGRHTLVVGATGSGKTVTQSWIAANAIARGMAAVVLDPKGDAGLRASVGDAAAAAGRELLAWSPHGEAIYNPFARGSETEIADKALAGEPFTEPHYLRQAQRYLGHVVRALRAGDVETSLHALVEHLDPMALERLSRELERRAGEPVQAYLDSLTARQRSDLSGVRDRLAILAESDVGQWLDPRRATPAARFDLLGAVRAGAVVYFDLEADTRPLLTQMLGAAIVQDLLTTVAALQARPQPTLVVIDEFSAIAPEHVVRLFARARSAGVSLLLGTQELSDLRLPGRERLLDQVTGNLSTLIAHRQVVPRSAELVASLAGTRDAWRVARHSDGRSTRTRTREGRLDPSRVMGLADGEAAVIGLEGGRGARLTRVFAPGSQPARRER